MNGRWNSRVHCQWKYERLVDWIMASWEKFDKQLVINSFKYCRMTVATDGSEDYFVQCVKLNQPCAVGLDRLKALHKGISEEKRNPFEDLIGQEESNNLHTIDEDDFEDDEIRGIL